MGIRGDILKIQCRYCGSFIEDTDEKCPNCGATNEDLKRTADTTPKTIEQLKAWYEAHHLPPSSVTRFFIGEDYTHPKAFGIYRKPNGHVVVYKNKADGSRAIRYEGADEAYGVNELYMRLKEEILQQKTRGIKNPSSVSNYSSGGKNKGKRRHFWSLKAQLILIFSIVFATIGSTFFFLHLESRPLDIPEGYYTTQITDSYQYGTLFYYLKDYNTWFLSLDYEDENVWKNLNHTGSSLPDDLKPSKFNGNQKKITALCLGKEYSPDYYEQYKHAQNFLKSQEYSDYLNSYSVAVGYYHYEDTDYYHMRPGDDSGWFYYDNDNSEWKPSYQTPDVLQHQNIAEAFYKQEAWDASTQVSDFETTDFYENYQDELRAASSYQSSSDSSDSYNSNDSDDDYSWDSSDSWDSGYTDWDSDW